MDNKIIVFKSDDFGTIRAIEIEGEPWFVGKDVAEVLGYKNTKDALLTHIDDDDKRILQRSEIATIENNIPKSVLNVNFVNGDVPNRGLSIINESGLYSLIMSSKLPGAKEFKHWVTSEVLPSIRKHGAYMTEVTIDNIIANPDFGIMLLTQLKEERMKSKALEEENKSNRPKVEYFDSLVDRKLLTGFRETAKELHVGQKEFMDFLLDNGYIYRQAPKNKPMPYQKYVDEGLFELKDCKSYSSEWAGTRVYITVKGKETFRLLLESMK